MTEGPERLLRLLDLEVIDRDIFRAFNPLTRSGRVFGGQVAAQALRAATLATTQDRFVNSLHAYFLRPGKPGQPILYTVDRIRDGTSFTTRRVVALQDGEAILNLDASFHRLEDGAFYEPPFERASLPDPETAEGEGRGAGGAIDVRPIPSPPGWRRRWIRCVAELPDDPLLHAAVITYASDMGAVGAASGPYYDPDAPVMRASLDHVMWFHQPVAADRWLLYALESVAAGRARGLARGSITTEDGVLGVTVGQEALLRPLRGSGRDPG